MSERKAQVSVRIRRELRTGLEQFAKREVREFSNLGELLLEWALEQLEAAGSLQDLLKYKIRRGPTQ